MQIRAKKISETFYLKSPEYFKIGSVIGIDEAGRGAWAGPVVAAACIFLDKKIRTSPHFVQLGDSKKIPEKGREILFGSLTEWKKLGWIDFEVGASTSEEIDTIGIKKANNLAMQRAVDGLLLRRNTWKNVGFLRVCIDGNDHYNLDIPGNIPSAACQENEHALHSLAEVLELIKGDGIIKEISAASILAKISRDMLLSDFGKLHTEYGFERHKGYGTAKHSEALGVHGILPFHRKSYAPIKKFTQSS